MSLSLRLQQSLACPLLSSLAILFRLPELQHLEHALVQPPLQGTSADALDDDDGLLDFSVTRLLAPDPGLHPDLALTWPWPLGLCGLGLVLTGRAGCAVVPSLGKRGSVTYFTAR